MGESCRLRILATWCSNKLSSGVQPPRGSRPFLRVGERERRAWKGRVGEKRWRERERKRQKRKRRRKRKDGRDKIAKRREEYLNRDVALQVGVRPSGCRSSGELVEESTLQRWHHRSRSQLTRLRWSERTEKSLSLHNYRCPRNYYYRLYPRGHDLNNRTDIGFNGNRYGFHALLTCFFPFFFFTDRKCVGGRQGCRVKWRKVETFDKGTVNLKERKLCERKCDMSSDKFLFSVIKGDVNMVKIEKRVCKVLRHLCF